VIDNARLFTGREVDAATGLQLNRNRFYHQPLGRWVSRDPIAYEGRTRSLYEYVASQPPSGVDPSGLLKWTGSVTFQFAALGWISSRIYVRFHAQAEDGCCIYITSFAGNLDKPNVLIQGGGYISFESQFWEVEAPKWPVNQGDRVGLTYFGVSSGVGGVDVSGGIEIYDVGKLHWWDYWTGGGFHIRTFSGGAEGRAPFVKKSAAKKDLPECQCAECKE
jgi:RHS repeat-associated protein